MRKQHLPGMLVRPVYSDPDPGSDNDIDLDSDSDEDSCDENNLIVSHHFT